jgi:anti-sigma factor RsiW
MKERRVAGMRCSEVLALLSDYVDGELDSAAVKNVESHLLGCPNCERFGRNFGSMVVSLRKELARSPDMQLDVMARLLARLRDSDVRS